MSGSRTTLRAVLIRVVAYPVLVYLTILAIFWSLQTSLIFVGTQLQGLPHVRIAPEDGVELVPLTTAGGDRIFALYGAALTAERKPRSDAASRPTLICFYGNGDYAQAAWRLAGQFRALGANVCLVEYPGYGISSGSPGETECYAAAEAAFDHVSGRADVDSTRILAVGWSMGGAVAVELATRRPVAGLVTANTFTSMSDMARISYPYVVVWPILRHRFDSVDKLERVTYPILIAHATGDTLVPYEMSDRLAEAARGPVTRVRVEGGGHNDVFAADGGKLFTELERFVDAAATARPAP